MKFLKSSMWLVILASLIASGCTTGTILKYAKKNEIVTIPLGGTKSVANSNYLKISDVTVTVTDSLDQVFPAQVFRLYRVYPDPSSRYALVSMDATSTPIPENHVPENQGQWMLQFLMPSTNAASQNIEPGTAQIAVVSTELNPDADPTKRLINTEQFSFGADLSNLSVEILAGTGNEAFNENAYGFLAHGATIITTPDDASVLANNVAGAVYVYEYLTASFTPDGIPHAVKTSPDQNLQLITNRKDAGGGITRLTAVIISPTGFFDNASWVAGASYYDALRVAVSWDNLAPNNTTVTDANWQSHISLVSAESFYVDLNGSPIASVSPVLAKVQ
jgi:hypothetical protein